MGANANHRLLQFIFQFWYFNFRLYFITDLIVAPLGFEPVTVYVYIDSLLRDHGIESSWVRISPAVIEDKLGTKNSLS